MRATSLSNAVEHWTLKISLDEVEDLMKGLSWDRIEVIAWFGFYDATESLSMCSNACLIIEILQRLYHF